jgi:hypothetical protein
VTPLAAPGCVARQLAFDAPHVAVPRWSAAVRAPGVGPVLPRHMRRRGNVAAPPCLAQQRQVNRTRAVPFLPPPPLLLSQARGRAAPSPPPIPAPNRLIWGGKSGGNRSPRLCEGIPLLLSLFYHCIL